MTFTGIRISKQKYRIRKWKLTDKGEYLLAKIVAGTIIIGFFTIMIVIAGILESW